MNAPRPGALARRLVRNTVHAASGRVVSVLTWAIFTPAILRGLGPAGFAVWALFFALTGYLAALDLGLVQGTLRHIASARHRGASSEGGAFVTLGVVGYVVLGAFWLLVAILLRDPILATLRIPPDQIPAAGFALIAGAAVFVIAGAANVAIAALQAYDRFDLANRVMLAVSLTQGAGIPFVLARGWGLRGLVVNLAVSWLIGGILAAWLLRRSVREFGWTSPVAALGHVREVVAFGGPMQLAGAMSVIHLHLDKFLLLVFVTLAAVTPYELGSRVVTSALTAPQLLLLAMLPTASAMHAAGNRPGLRMLYDRGSHYLLATAAVTIAVLLGSAGRLFQAWLGVSHEEATLVLRGLALASTFVMATGMASITARAIGRTDLEAFYGVSTVVLHLVLSLALVPTWGVRGALIASLVSGAITSCLFVVQVARALDWSPRELLVGIHLPPALAVLAGGAAGWGLDRVLPPAEGAAAWSCFLLTTAVSAAAAAAVLLGSGFFKWREARALLDAGLMPDEGRA